MPVPFALGGREVHEVPRKEWVGQRHIGVNAGSRESVAVEVHTFFEIAAFGESPIAGDGLMTDVGEEEQIAVPVMEAFAEVDARAMQRIDEGRFLQTRFVNRATRTVIRARRPFDHPVEDFELAELFLPRWDTFSAEIIDEGMLAGSGTHGEQRTQVFIEQIPFLFEAVESAGGLFFCGLFESEQVFVGKLLLRGHE